MNNTEFGRFICDLRKEKGLTQLELANLIHTSDKAISRWENGKNYPDIEMLEEIADILDVSISELIACKKIESESEAVKISEQAFVKEAKTGRVRKNIFIAIISLLLVIIIAMGIVFNCNPTYDYTVNKIGMVSSDTASVVKNVSAQMLIDSAGASVVVDSFDCEFTSDMTAEFLYVSADDTEGYNYYSQSLGSDDKLDYCKVYKSKKQIGCYDGGLSLNALSDFLRAFNIKNMNPDDNGNARYSITLNEKGRYFDLDVSNLNVDCYVFDNGELKKLDKSSHISGFYAQLDVFYDSHSIISIYLPSGDAGVNACLEKFFKYYSTGDFDSMRACCSKEFINQYFHKNDVFGNEKAWCEYIMNIEYNSDDKYYTVELWQGCKPNDVKAAAFPIEREYLKYVITNDYIITDLTD